jgi:peptide/nickel transport system permease protein
MQPYLMKRLSSLIVVFFCVTVLVFTILRLTPGDPAMVMLGPQASSEDVAALRQELGLNDPLPVQYVRWMGRVVQGDLGRSIQTRVRIAPELMAKLENTLWLTTAALLLTMTLGIAVGVFSAARRGSVADRILTVLSLIGVSMPIFWLGIMLTLVFSLRLKWLPGAGMYSPRGGGGLDDLLMHLILPAITLAMASIAIVARMTRSTMLDVLSQDYVRTAKAKGLSERVVTYRHALKNALIPILTVAGVQVGYLMGGAVLTETVFAWPGLGSLMLTAINARDFPMVQGATLLVATLITLVNLVVDVLYVAIDPRIRYS